MAVSESKKKVFETCALKHLQCGPSFKKSIRILTKYNPEHLQNSIFPADRLRFV